MHVVVHLLKNRSEERPSFSDIKEYIESEIQMQSAKQLMEVALIQEVQQPWPLRYQRNPILQIHPINHSGNETIQRVGAHLKGRSLSEVRWQMY